MLRKSPVQYAENNRLLDTFGNELQSLLVRQNARHVCDIGGGRNPQLAPAFIQKMGIEYTICDISQDELDLAPADYHKRVADIGDRSLHIVSEYDFVFSRMVAEHIKDGEQFHRNVYQMLKPGGIAFHFFPTFYCLPFIVNRLMPEHLADWILNIFNPRDRKVQGKFPAYYSWCRGPIPSHIRRLKSIGYEIELYQGFFGHGYFERVPVIREMHLKWKQHLLRKPNPRFTSYAFLVLRRPLNESNAN